MGYAVYIRDFSGAAVSIEGMEIRKSPGCHSRCQVRAAVAEEVARDWLDKAGEPFLVTLSAKDRMPVFCGFIASVAKKTGVSGTSLAIVALSESARHDREARKRIFQNPEKTCGDMVNSVRPENFSIAMAEGFSSRKCPEPVLQDGTDFAFLLRLAGGAGTRLWVDDVRENRPGVRIADNVPGAAIRADARKVVSLEETRRERGPEKVALTSREYLECGRLVRLGEAEYVVLSLRSALEHGSDVFFYELEAAGHTPEPALSFQPAVKLVARVTDTGDPEHRGRIQVRFQDVEDEADTRLWIPYRPPYGGRQGGVVFLPDKDDLVEVLLTDAGPWTATTLREEALAEECRDVAQKYIGNNSGQRIFWKENSLELWSAENRIILDDKRIRLERGDQFIELDEKGIRLETPKNILQLGEDGIRLESKGGVGARAEGDLRLEASGAAQLKSKGSLVLASDASANVKGSEFNVKASGKVTIKGASIDLC